MADENEVKIIIRAVSDASNVLKQIANDVKAIAANTKAMIGTQKEAAAAVSNTARAQSEANKQAAAAQKLSRLAAVTDTQRARAAEVISRTQSRAATEEQRRLSESAKVSAQVAQINQRAATQQAQSEAQLAAINERVTQLRLRNEELVTRAKERAIAATERQAKAEQRGLLQTSPGIQSVINNVKAMGEQFIIAGAIVTGFSLTLKKAFDLGEEGAQLERLQTTGTALARSFGVDMVRAVQLIKAASVDTITTQQAILATNRALMLGVAADAEQLAA